MYIYIYIYIYVLLTQIYARVNDNEIFKRKAMGV